MSLCCFIKRHLGIKTPKIFSFKSGHSSIFNNFTIDLTMNFNMCFLFLYRSWFIKKMATFELYRRSTIGMCLTETLDEMVSNGVLTPELAIQVLVQFDKVSFFFLYDSLFCLILCFDVLIRSKVVTLSRCFCVSC